MLLGRYQILDRLGAGGMGVVYRGVSLGVDGFKKAVVIKRIRGLARRRSVEALERFLNEARILMTMSHGNIVQILDLCKVNDEHFMVLEHVEGVDLFTLLKRCEAIGQWPSQPLTLLIVSQVLRGLDYAHRRTDEQGASLGIVHRDVKPANVLCSAEGEIKLTDFGVASLAGASLTQAGDLIGTVSYMSPEQASGEPVDLRSDLFSAGTILYLLLCQRQPFGGPDIDQVRQSVCNARLTPPSALGVEVLPEVEQLLLTSMARDRAGRYPSAGAMLGAVEACQRLLPAATASDLQVLFRRIFGDDPSVWRACGLEEAHDSLVGTEIRGSRGSAPLTGVPTASFHGTEAKTAASRPAAADSSGLAGSSTASVVASIGGRRKGLLALVAVLLLGATVGTIVATSRRAGTRSPPDASPTRRDALIEAPKVAALAPGKDAGADVASPGPPRAKIDPGPPRAKIDPGPPRAKIDPGPPRAKIDPGPPRAKIDPRPSQRRQLRRAASVDTTRSGWVLVSTRPAYAVVYAGGSGRQLGTTPCRIRLPAGSHTLRLVNQGLGLTVTRKVTVRPDAETRLTLGRFGSAAP